MAHTLTIRDQTTAGGDLHEFTLDFLTERITVRELIRSRVFQEVKDYNARQPGYFRGLVQPTDAEAALNGYQLKKKRMIDWQPQYDAAVRAFERNQILILVGERQCASLEEEIEVAVGQPVSFVKLVPLVGG